MTERPRPDLDHVREALRERDERADEDDPPTPPEPPAPADEPGDEDD